MSVCSQLWSKGPCSLLVHVNMFADYFMKRNINVRVIFTGNVILSQTYVHLFAEGTLYGPVHSGMAIDIYKKAVEDAKNQVS